MKNYLFLIGIIVITSCSSKYPLKVNIDDYTKGLEITNSNISTVKKLQSYCVEFDDTVLVEQPLIEETDQEVLYTYSSKDLEDNYNAGKKCTPEETLKITSIQSIFHWDGMMRLNIYKAKISINSISTCKNIEQSFTSTKESKLKKHGKMITLGVVGEEKTKAMIAAVVVLAFDDVISDIYSQINERCKSGY